MREIKYEEDEKDEEKRNFRDEVNNIKFCDIIYEFSHFCLNLSRPEFVSLFYPEGEHREHNDYITEKWDIFKPIHVSFLYHVT